MRTAFLESLSEEEARFLLHHWPFWARADQLPPADDHWRTWVVLGGRGAGKTRTGAEWLRALMEGNTPPQRGEYRRAALIGETMADVRDVMVHGPSGLIAVAAPAFRPRFEPSKRRLVWPNGAQALLFSSEDPDSLRGPQFDAAWLDEFAKFTYPQETWDMLQFALRLGGRPRQVVTTTPRPLAALKAILNDPHTVVSHAPTAANRAFLAQGFVKAVTARYGGTRLGRQELEGELLERPEGALWTPEMVETARLKPPLPDLARIVVAVDPPVSHGPEADECGIIVAGRDFGDRGYVLADRSVQGQSPLGWARIVVSAYRSFEADRIVAEANQGGEMVRTVIAQADPSAAVRMVHARRGKTLRAEPVAALYEQGRISHVGVFPKLEDQMFAFGAEGSGAGASSPDRVDALVWALTELLLRGAPPEPKLRTM
ncbi:MAG: DNA-packaging protein [Alphaproteobacteria bacterium]